MKRASVVAVSLAVLLSQSVAPTGAVATAPADALTYFKSFFVTGDYAVAGTGLRGRGVNGYATGTVRFVGVPADADIVAAFLYWQVVSKDALGPESGSNGVKLDGKPLSALVTQDDGSVVEKPSAKLIGAGSPPCWSAGGGTGTSGGSKVTYTYRADVLRYFDIDPDTGKPSVNGAHTITVPDSGSSGNELPIALGASLVIVYRDPARPLSAIVFYDGAYTLGNETPTMRQTIAGFYQSATGTGRLTHIVGSGDQKKSEVLQFNGATLYDSPFGAYAGASWDNPTFAVSFPPDATAVTTSVDPSADCLTWGATIFQTPVKDSDRDGLIDVWETDSNLVDPNGQPLPDLRAMGADPNVKDLFVEVGYMKTDVATLYGSVAKPPHSHLPSHDAIKLVGDAFKKAAVDPVVANPDPSRPSDYKGIRLHVDVGHGYPTGSADEYIVRGTDADGAALARGGEAIDEAGQDCTRAAGDPPWRCQFSAYPGTVGWKTGFRFFRDQVIGGQPSPAPDEEDPCDAPGNDGPGQACERRFDRNRRHAFHYALFAHAVGLPKSDLPCLDAEGRPAEDVNGSCPTGENPDFRVPRTITGVGDFPGGDVLVTLGAFSDVAGQLVDADGDGPGEAVWTPLPVGTPFMQASTLMHELGHNLERRHGGEPSEPNCKPTYLSVMNYLYQLRGLLDDAGRPNLDFSRGVVQPAVEEGALADGSLGTAPLAYRIGWYAPLAGSYLAGKGTAAAKHCDGSGLLLDPAGLPLETPMVRIDARTAAGPIDWNANGATDLASVLDVNFNGRQESLNGSDDWSNIRLDQVGVRRPQGALFLDRERDIAMGPLSIDGGRSDYGRSDYGRSDYGRSDYGRSDYGGEAGRSDYGRSDYGRSDYGRSDYGRSDYGRGDYGRGDYGGGDLFLGDPNSPGGELDFETAGDLAKTPPNAFNACIIGGSGLDACAFVTTPLHKVRLEWTAPNVGGVSQYLVYRVAGDTIDPGETWVLVPGPYEVVCPAGTPESARCYSAIDNEALPNGAQFTYFAVAEYFPDTPGGPAVKSDPSNLVTVTAVNDPPFANPDSYTTSENVALSVAAPGVLANDADPDTPSTLTAVVAANGGPLTIPTTWGGSVVLKADGSFDYTPAPNYFGSDSFTYAVTDGSVATAPATVSIDVGPVNDPPTAVDDSATVAEDSAAFPIGVLANDSFLPDAAETLTVTTVTQGAHGSVTIVNGGAAVTYTPQPDYHGPDAFSYAISDGNGGSANAMVRVTVTPVNDAPLARGDSYGTAGGATLTVAAPGVLGNDSDPEGGALTAELVSGPANGTLTLNPNGSFSYTPAPGFGGSDSFTYRANDGGSVSNYSNVATVTIQVTALYAFHGTKNAPPAPVGSSFKAGSSIPMKWQFRNGTIAVDSASVQHQVTVKGPLPNEPIRYITNTDPGSSSFRYDHSSKTWYFNLQTKDLDGRSYPVGTYEVTVTPTTPGFGASAPFTIKLVK